METFDFSEALSFMKCGLPVIGPNGRKFMIENNSIICYPDPINRPKQKRIEYKITPEAIFYTEWTLAE